MNEEEQRERCNQAIINMWPVYWQTPIQVELSKRGKKRGRTGHPILFIPDGQRLEDSPANGSPLFDQICSNVSRHTNQTAGDRLLIVIDDQPEESSYFEVATSAVTVLGGYTVKIGTIWTDPRADSAFLATEFDQCQERVTGLMSEDEDVEERSFDLKFLDEYCEKIEVGTEGYQQALDVFTGIYRTKAHLLAEELAAVQQIQQSVERFTTGDQ